MEDEKAKLEDAQVGPVNASTGLILFAIGAALLILWKSGIFGAASAATKAASGVVTGAGNIIQSAENIIQKILDLNYSDIALNFYDSDTMQTLTTNGFRAGQNINLNVQPSSFGIPTGYGVSCTLNITDLNGQDLLDSQGSVGFFSVSETFLFAMPYSSTGKATLTVTARDFKGTTKTVSLPIFIS
jgi:hypothetical protein